MPNHEPAPTPSEESTDFDAQTALLDLSFIGDSSREVLAVNDGAADAFRQGVEDLHLTEGGHHYSHQLDPDDPSGTVVHERGLDIATPSGLQWRVNADYESAASNNPGQILKRDHWLSLGTRITPIEDAGHDDPDFVSPNSYPIGIKYDIVQVGGIDRVIRRQTGGKPPKIDPLTSEMQAMTKGMREEAMLDVVLKGAEPDPLLIGLTQPAANDQRATTRVIVPVKEVHELFAFIATNQAPTE